MAFSPNGKRLALASWDSTVRVFPATPDGLLLQACRVLRSDVEIGQVKDACTAVAKREEAVIVKAAPVPLAPLTVSEPGAAPASAPNMPTVTEE